MRKPTTAPAPKAKPVFNRRAETCTACGKVRTVNKYGRCRRCQAEFQQEMEYAEQNGL